MIDKPDFAHHIHKRAVPRSGGLGMMLAFAGIYVAYVMCLPRGGGNIPREEPWLLLLLGILLHLGVQDALFVHSYCYGIKALGTIDELGSIVEYYHVGKVVVTEDMPERELMQQLMQMKSSKLVLYSLTKSVAVIPKSTWSKWK